MFYNHLKLDFNDNIIILSFHHKFIDMIFKIILLKKPIKIYDWDEFS